MTLYVPSEKEYLLHLCDVHGIKGEGDLIAASGSWHRVIEDMNAEAPRHLEGGDLFNGDPWPVRQYTWQNVPFACRRWMRIRRIQMRNALDAAREKNVE
ncbi:predicted protein [Sclerotinia sclerotiorum 1980 UF-70]|uniref:Uncharacterized protein n=2 Tax=Sclerotinia sclerotiorum (strain ATCC 18683 / 1980 / Ss-1) TaxID=665079 RepID=A7EWL2_SCLS1|nr:predicted protein [Sclerotinia sclerotiorum 1980 UF-70]APA05319.1 hypothetical protein sscle_01g000890 [Sclerotinia sclerotiorum 1980 UF-70]EDN93854.1 predicted protein [Sclerotinia sclerotiorum 1980 UF-70]